MKIISPIISLILFVVFILTTTLSAWESAAVAMFIYFFFDFLDNLGKKIVIMDLSVVMAIATCLIMPVVFYHEYDKESLLARIWVKYMPIPSDQYFSFALPATFAMILGIRVRLRRLKINKDPRVYIDNVKEYLATKTNIGLQLIAVGVISGMLDFVSPTDLKQVFYLLDHLTYVGVFYILYSPNKHKRIIVPSVIALMVGQTIITGMFGDFVFMLACSLILILLGNRTSFTKKLMYAFLGIFFILVIQSIKIDYRKRNWLEGAGADPIYFAQLITDRITDPASLLDPNKIFYAAVRMNQGWLVAVTMQRVPDKRPYAYGETIWMSVAASIVPRFLWPDKPKVGGAENIKRFWGVDLHGYSINLGPLGEAYGNFGATGGVVYMFFYGLVFNLILSGILKLAEKRPTLVLWLPFLFFYAVVVETDLLTTLGSLIKAVFFTWIIFKAFRITFRVKL